MLDDTSVVWGGEFGRTPMAQGDGFPYQGLGQKLTGVEEVNVVQALLR